MFDESMPLKNWIIAGVVLLVVFLAPLASYAQSGVDREVSWSNATQYTDGSPLPVGTFETVIVMNGVEAARVPSTSLNVVIPDVPWGESDFYAYHVDDAGNVGLPSNVVVTYVQPVPQPPTGVTVAEVLAALRAACDAPGNPSAFRDVCTLLASL